MKVKVKHYIDNKWVTNLTYAKYKKLGMDLTHRCWWGFDKKAKTNK